MKKALYLVGLLLAAASVAHTGVEIMPTHGRSIYRLAVAELDGQPAANEIVGSTYDDRVGAFSVDGKHLWDAPTGRFVFDLAADEFDDDGAAEVAVLPIRGQSQVWVKRLGGDRAAVLLLNRDPADHLPRQHRRTHGRVDCAGCLCARESRKVRYLDHEGHAAPLLLVTGKPARQ